VSHAAAIIDRPPGHARILGPPGSGKTTLLVERYHALVARGHRPGIVAFGRQQRDRLLERVIPPGSAHLGAPPVTTHALLASFILDAARPRRPRTLRDVDELLVLARILRRESTLLASDLSAISGSPTFLRDLLETLHALAQNGISFDQARSCAKRCANPRARDVLLVYVRYHELCAERGLVSFYDAAWRAAECIDAGGVESPLSEFDVVLVDDFHDLDPGQYRLLTRLVPPHGPVKLEVFGDPTGARFSFRGTSDRFLLDVFPRDYAPVDVELSMAPSADAAWNETVAQLVSETEGAALPATPPSDLPLFTSAQSRETYVARPSHATATTVLLADDEVAEAQAVAARARAAIDAGVPPREIAVVTREASRYRAVLELACHEWGVPLDGGGEENRATNDFLRSLLGALGSDPDGRFAEGLAASPFALSLCDGSDVDTVVGDIRRTHTSKEGFQFEKLIADRVAPLCAPGDTALTAAADEWQRYRDVVEHAGGGVSLDEFRATYLAGRGESAPHGSGILLLSAREATGRSFRVVFVCGCVEGVFPGAETRNGYLPLAAIARALEAEYPDAARDIAARLDDAAIERSENALFLTALTRATDVLTITTPTRIDGKPATSSRALAVDTRAFTTIDAPRVQSPCARAAHAVSRSEPDSKRAERLRALDRLAGWWAMPKPEERLPVRPGFSMSASKLNSYARCPRQFFFRNILKIKEPESIYLRVGNLVHDALKEIIPPGATGEEVREALQHAGTREIAERLVTGKFADAGAWMRELSVKYLEDILRDVAELESQREGNYRVRMLEEEVEGNVEGMPLRGRLDRVDDIEGIGSVVIDYKISGSVDKSYGTVLKKMESSYWQIPVYAFMSTFKDVTPAAFVYYVLPPGDESHATGVQLAAGPLRPPIPLGRSKAHPRFGHAPREVIVEAMAHAVEIHRSIVEGECSYPLVENTQICPNCHYARICQRSPASI
jgi:superfamily I DNA/RNA helicase/CRISPR/Cas system-associated exonuclease Cas4 (RecB family)